MPNAGYDSARRAFLAGELDWDADDFTIAVYDSDLTFDAADDVLDDITALPLDTAMLTGKAVSSTGLASNDATEFTVQIGDTSRAYLLYRDTGTPSTSTLIYFWDTNNDLSAINRAGDGNPYSVPWSQGTIQL